MDYIKESDPIEQIETEKKHTLDHEHDAHGHEPVELNKRDVPA